MFSTHSLVTSFSPRTLLPGSIPRRVTVRPLTIAAASNEEKPKARRGRKKAVSAATTPNEDPAPTKSTTAVDVDTTNPAASPRRVEVHAGSLQRLQGSSDTLRELLERRARRQSQALPSIPPSAITTAASPTTSPTSTPSSSRTSSLTAIPEIPAEAVPLRKAVRVRFWINFQINYGENIVVVGGCPEMGSWSLNQAAPLKWTEGHNWNATIDVPAGTVVEYKYVVVNNQGQAISWQSGNNSVLAIKHTDTELDVYDNWWGNPGAQVAQEGAPPATRENRLLSWASDIEASLTAQRQELRRARMELVAAQEDARQAREEARRYKAQLSIAEGEKLTALSNLKQAETVNKLLQAQLAETTSSFRAAIETAAQILGKLDRIDSTKTAGASSTKNAAIADKSSGSSTSSAAAPTTTTATATTPPPSSSSSSCSTLANGGNASGFSSSTPTSTNGSSVNGSTSDAVPTAKAPSTVQAKSGRF